MQCPKCGKRRYKIHRLRKYTTIPIDADSEFYEEPYLDEDNLDDERDRVVVYECLECGTKFS